MAPAPRSRGPQTGPPTLSVVVCAYTLERWEVLLAAVASLRAQHRPAEEVLLVTDHCPELAARAAPAMPGVRVVPNRERKGLSGARNTGVAEARGEVVAFLDDDAAAAPDWTGHLLAGYRDPHVLGVGGLVRPLWETGRPAWFPPEFDWVVGCSYRGLPERSGPVRNFIGANMSFRREAVLSAGGFRTDLGRVGTRPLGCEETELCLRLTARDPDAVLLYEPAAAVDHHVPAARAGWSYYLARCRAEGLSKAAVARHAGTSRGLSSERRHLLSTLPRACGRALLPGGPGPRRAGAIAAGAGLTLAGYATGRLRDRAPDPTRPTRPGPADLPVPGRARPRSSGEA